jgi:16S rRNA (uracil1498-N3)-methyltransferase
MRVPRIYTPQPLTTGAVVALEEEAANHVGRVLRLRPGAPLRLFNGAGGEFEAAVAQAGKREVTVEIGAHLAGEAESPLQLTLIQSISRGERMDFTLQKAVELGVTRIVPVFSARSVVSLDGDRLERRHEHWMKIIVGACEQSGRNRLPQLAAACDLAQALASGPEGLRLVLDPVGAEALSALPGASAITLLVGPEGGLDDRELAQARAAGFRGLRLGPRVLRTETAALVALSVLQARWGDLI